jgi:hypothetical protein
LSALAEPSSKLVPVPLCSDGAGNLGFKSFLRDLTLACCPDAIRDMQERVATMHCPRPPAEDVATYVAGRLCAGLFAEHQGLELPAALVPGFIELSDELYRAIQSDAVKRWLDGATNHGFSVEFVARLVVFLNGCLDCHRKELGMDAA